MGQQIIYVRTERGFSSLLLPQLYSGIEKFPCVPFVTRTIETNSCLLVSCCGWWSLVVPAEHQELLTGPMQPEQQVTGRAQCPGEGEPEPSRPTPYFPALCGALPGDDGPLQCWNSATCKEENPPGNVRATLYARFWGRGYSNASFISLSHACTDSSTSLRTC